MTSISFHYVWPDADAGEYGSAEYPASALKISKPVPDSLVDGDEFVIHTSKLTLRVDYPLENPADISVTSPSTDKGFTRRELAQAIFDAYRRIYQTEEQTSSAPAQLVPGLQNRDAADGEYGISAHNLEDLMLVRVVYNEAEDVWEVRVDS